MGCLLAGPRTASGMTRLFRQRITLNRTQFHQRGAGVYVVPE